MNLTLPPPVNKKHQKKQHQVMAPTNMDPICKTGEGRNMVLCQAKGYHRMWNHLATEPHKANLGNIGTQIGAETYTDVAIDNSKQGTMTASVNIEQTMGSIIVILGILIALYLCRYGFQSFRQTTITHFGNAPKLPHPNQERPNRDMYRPQPPPRYDSTIA